MRKLLLIKSLIVAVFFIAGHVQVFGQRFLTEYDSTLFVRDTLRPFIKRFENLNFGGYIQPQFQVAERKGAPSYNGGNFSEFSSSRFMLRRARIKLDFILPAPDRFVPKVLFTFQIDATERGVNVRDMFVRLYEPRQQALSLTTGLFARPFGYEVNLSSAYRETPERGRMSQILMPTERDLGAMLTLESQSPDVKKRRLKWDAGFFNGPGLSGTTDFDTHKDFISRLTIKPLGFSKTLYVSGGLSLLYGGWRQGTKYRYTIKETAGTPGFELDSAETNVGKLVPRHYYGADVQLVSKHARGKTELRGEYWFGKQPGTAATTVNPGTEPLLPTYVRPFNGAFFYFLQNIVNSRWELMLKYDWYDPNTKATPSNIGNSATHFTAADIRYTTLGAGLTRYINPNLKVLVYYDRVWNETPELAGYASDIKDDIFTCRVQVRF